MKTLFFRFPDQATFEATLPEGFAYAGEVVTPLPDGVTAISILGAYYTQPVLDAEGNVVTPGTLVPGFHLNALGDLPDAWASYQIFPNNPGRIFGDDA